MYEETSTPKKHCRIAVGLHRRQKDKKNNVLLVYGHVPSPLHSEIKNLLHEDTTSSRIK